MTTDPEIDSQKAYGSDADKSLQERLRASFPKKPTSEPAPAAQPTLEDQVVRKIAKDLADDHRL